MSFGQYGRAATAGFGTLLGVSVHLFLFNRGEWHVQAPQIALVHLWVALVTIVGKAFYQDSAIGHLLDSLQEIFLTYVAAIFASIVIYRLRFHPLTKSGFPGPKIARISKLWHVWACRKSKNHLILANLHEKYGDFIRTGPSEITVFHPDVFWALDGPGSECIKAEWYDILHPSLALVTARVKSTHGARRRQWNRGFTSKALALHEQKITACIDELEECIAEDARNGAPSEVRDLFFWLGFDSMGDFVFNKSFDMMKNRQWHHIIVRLQSALSLLGPFSPTPWLIQIGFKLGPRVSKLRDWFEMVAWCEAQMRERIQSADTDSFTPDLTHYLMEKSGTHDMEDESWFWLKGDSLLAIVAGSEPTASALIGIFNELAKAPHYVEELYAEIKDLDLQDSRMLEKPPLLNGVINEGLRLYPALFTGGGRKTTANGAVIGGVFLPPHTTIIAPRFSISRRDDCFVRPTEFLPERWSTAPELMLNRAAFTPFGTGHHSCLGRPLATNMMRLVIARLVKRFHIRFAPGEDGQRVMRDLRDQFTSNPGGLTLVFDQR